MATADPAPQLVPFVCTACAAHLRLPASYLGKAILCPKCNAPQRVVNAEAPLEPMDTTRALRADEIPVRPIGAVSGMAPAVRVPRPFKTPLPADLPPAQRVAIEADFDPLTAPAARRVPDAALTASGLRRTPPPAADLPELTMAFVTPPPPAAAVVAPRSRTLLVVLGLLGVLSTVLAVTLVLTIQALGAEREQRHLAEQRADSARAAAEEAARQSAASERRLTELVHSLSRPASAKP
jgi:hypothetical protein